MAQQVSQFLDAFSGFFNQPLYHTFHQTVDLSTATLAQISNGTATVAGKLDDKSLQVVSSTDPTITQGSIIPMATSARRALLEGEVIKPNGVCFYPLYIDDSPGAILELRSKNAKPNKDIFRLALATTQYGIDRLVGTFNASTTTHDLKNAVLNLENRISPEEFQDTMNRLSGFYRDYTEPIPCFTATDDPGLVSQAEDFFRTARAQYFSAKQNVLKQATDLRKRININGAPELVSSLDKFDKALTMLGETSPAFLPTECCVNEFVQSTIKAFCASPRAQDMEVITDLKSEQRTFLYPALMDHALLNLLQNAGDTSADTITVRTYDDETSTNIAVNDNGPGFPQKVRDRFGEWELTTKEGGSGRGIPGAKNACQVHGGDLSLTGKSTLRMQIPIYTARLRVNEAHERLANTAAQTRSRKEVNELMHGDVTDKGLEGFYRHGGYLISAAEALRESGERSISRLEQHLQGLQLFRQDLEAVRDKYTEDRQPLNIQNREIPLPEAAHTIDYYSTLHLGHIAITLKDYDSANKAFESNLRKAQTPLERAKAMNNLGLVASERKKLDAARNHHKRAIRELRDNPELETSPDLLETYVDAHLDLVDISLRQAKPYSEVENHLNIALEKSRKLANNRKFPLSSALNLSAEFALRRARRMKNPDKKEQAYREAILLADECIQVAQEAGYIHHQRESSEVKCAAYQALGDEEQATPALEKSQRLIKIHGSRENHYIDKVSKLNRHCTA